MESSTTVVSTHSNPDLHVSGASSNGHHLNGASSNGHHEEPTSESIARLADYLDRRFAKLGATRQTRRMSILEQFCEELIVEAVASVREECPSNEPPTVDWRRVWDSANATSMERAIGHSALEAQKIADEIRGINGSALPGEDRLNVDASHNAASTPHLSPVPLLTTAASDIDDIGAATASDEAQSRIASLITDEARQRRNRRLRRAFVACGWVRDIGFILILFAGWQLWGTSIEQSQSQHALRQQFQSDVQSRVAPTSPNPVGPSLISASINVSNPPEGSVIGHLQIPAIGVDQYVVEGTTEADLSKGPGHYVGTSVPGQAGNVAIAGHRTTYGAPFNNLGNLKIGDPIFLTTDSGERLTYIESRVPIAVSPQDVSVLNAVNDNRLTLTTCNPRFSDTQRLVAVALLSKPQGVVATPVVKPRLVRVVAGPTGWNMEYLPAVLLVLSLLIGLGLINRRAHGVYGRVGRWLVLTPIWTAGLIFLFDLLTRLLPANL